MRSRRWRRTRRSCELAQSELARAQKLLDSQAVSRQEVDQWTSGSRTSQADVHGAEAALRVARLNLEYTAVRAPISGRMSRANVTVGNLVNEQSVLTTIAGVSKVYAYFDGSEQTYLRFKATQSGGKAPTVRMALARRAGLPARRPARLRRQPPQPADRRDPPARELRQRQAAASRRA